MMMSLFMNSLPLFLTRTSGSPILAIQFSECVVYA